MVPENLGSEGCCQPRSAVVKQAFSSTADNCLQPVNAIQMGCAYTGVPITLELLILSAVVYEVNWDMHPPLSSAHGFGAVAALCHTQFMLTTLEQ